MPGLRTAADELPVKASKSWPTGLPQLDELLRGGLPQSAVTEIVARSRTCGSALLISSLLHRSAEVRQLAALIDGQDSLDVTPLEPEILSRLLWVRCHSADEALKAADLLLHDGNLPLVLLDLVLNPAAQLRKIPATTWYRLQRIIEETSVALVALTPRPIIGPAQVRITLSSHFGLDALDCDQGELARELKMEVAGTHVRTANEPLRQSA